MTRLLPSLSWILLVTPWAHRAAPDPPVDPWTGQEGSAAVTEEAPSGSELLERVAVLGASLSKGFMTPVTLADVLDAAMTAPHEGPADVANLMMFSAPADVLERQLLEVRAAKPTLVVGVDLAFWFAYGDVSLASRVMTDDERVDNLKRFLLRLESLGVPLVLADFPDMREAIGFMLRAEQVPSPQVLEELNRTLYAWAEGVEDVLVLPLRALTDAIRADEGVTIGDHVWPAAGEADRVLQGDRLHPTLEGLVLIAHLLAHELVEAGWVERDELIDDPARLLTRVQDRRRSSSPGGEKARSEGDD